MGYFGYLYINAIIGHVNPDGLYPCAYDHEGHWSIAFLRRQGKEAGPLAAKEVLYSNFLNESALLEEERLLAKDGVLSDTNLYSKSTISPHAITCADASKPAVNGVRGPPVSFVADPFIFFPPKEARRYYFLII